MGLMALSSHDLYLKLDSYFLEPNTTSALQLFNGTFDRSENVIDRDRMLDVSIAYGGQRIQAAQQDWFEKDSITYLTITTEGEGTYVAGVSTKPRVLSMSAEDFNDYLKHDGVLDVLESRQKNNQLNDPATEQYSKHVKSIFQVGETSSADFGVKFGYPIEFVAFNNPYDLHPGEEFRTQLLFQDAPLSNQLVYLGYQPPDLTHTHDGSTHTHEQDQDHEHSYLIPYRTDENGELNVALDKPGVWYLRTIHLVDSNEEGLTHQSNWATLTFAVVDHHQNEDSSLVYLYILGSILFIGILYFVFSTKKV